ncbi:gamma-glutamylcyclotransferase [Novosphingobium sp. TH158]|uniref:gamma-glutamylcyclotransferase family protein n=1 Tax=Novosphingobium sp. TH158 TaxID=2067455 RepID=UPI000C7A954A|nr:gamma-glutamylcyclotransferase family protein [Novosphingobium sp. TH158]PLK26917.1 hypothetical protein C0V78_08465 [Novosphingobium sp. TH158]
MGQPLRFFFYGTLLDGGDNPVAQEVHRLLEPGSPASVRGALHALPDAAGWFPALVAGEGEVFGRVYTARPQFTGADLARLDAYEDFDPVRPATSLYLRREVALTGGGAAQAYLFNQPLPPGSRPIRSGDFRSWLRETGLAPFTGLREA